MGTVLEVSNVSYSYHTLSGETPALSNITFSVPEGEFLAIVGPSGCGKSTLLSMIASLMEPESGTISIHGSPASMSRHCIGYMLQKDHLFEWRTIYKNVILGLEIQNRMTEKNLEHVEQLLRDYGLDQFRNARPSELSGGMRQRVVIAIALACDPDLLICDEPTTALDVTIQAKILELIRRIQKERGISVIYITHDLGVVAKVADYVDVMYAGKIVETGTIDEIFYDPKHPYTWGLLSAMPDLDTADDRLYTIPGSPPNLLHEKPGDAFAPRNRFALNIDDEIDPPMFKISDTHYAATWLLDPRAPKVEMPPELKERIARMKAEAKKIEEAE